uniref:Uncharacterized protein n=1 Tax=Meloidogyne enterolobii TaxID=390850 RepID=A0A6V7Y002_MELEN|nr:unnamed protein product [Meloidogyne enterolobii]
MNNNGSVGNNGPNTGSLPLEETGHDSVTHRALLKNELLKHSIIDVRSDCDSTDSVQILQRSTPHSLFKYTHKVPNSVGGSLANAASPLFSSSPLSAGLLFSFINSKIFLYLET